MERKEKYSELEDSLQENVEEINSKLYRRWYDDDDILSSVMTRMEYSTDDYKERIAMQIIKIVVSLNIADVVYKDAHDLMNALNSGYLEKRRNRWYDYNTTVRTAMCMLQVCPPEKRHKVSLEVKKYITLIDRLPL